VSGFRIGIGVDAHAYTDGAALVVGGVGIPGEAGLAGHSDGDVVAHALTDALLAAAGLGDIGGLLGTDDPRWAGARGAAVLAHVREVLAAAGWRVGNAAVQLIAPTPRLGPRRAEAEAVLSEALGAPVSVTATTTDGLGLTGRGEGRAAIATALVVRVG
jgi:2-C-methyl-D-erythritol 2,4-cyclodiphosphate synthase